MGQITVMTGPDRRRRWSDEERFQILAEAFAPGVCVADVARRRDVSTSLIFTWRRKLREEHADAVSLPMAKVGFAEAVITGGFRGRRLSGIHQALRDRWQRLLCRRPLPMGSLL